MDHHPKSQNQILHYYYYYYYYYYNNINRGRCLSVKYSLESIHYHLSITHTKTKI